jgi:hypothetical protein
MSTYGKFHSDNLKIGFIDCGAVPYITGVALDPAKVASGYVEVEIAFPSVARFVEVRNTLSASNVPVRVHLNSIADSLNVITGAHFIPLNEYNTSCVFKVPVDSVFLSLPSMAATGSATVYAELTMVASGALPVLTGSGLTA